MPKQMGPEHFRDEIIECLSSESTAIDGTGHGDKLKEAEKYLRRIFSEVAGNYDYPTYPKLMAALKLLMSREYKAGKNEKVVADNFLKITKKIKNACNDAR